MVSHIGIFFPFFLGVQAASWIYREYGADTHFFAFALMMGIGMSITAFPVLVRMLQESGLIKTSMGQLALSAAAVDDVTAWLLLSVIIALISASSMLVVAWTLIALLVFIILMVAVVRPLYRYWYQRFQPSEMTAAAALLFLLFFSATATEVIGIHTIFGAFVAGTIVPKDSPLCEHLTERLEYFCTMFLLPIFFVISGLRTHLELLRLQDIPTTAVLVAVAIIGKWGGAWAAGRVAGLSNKESVLIGALMNTRGLMELIVLNIAYELGIFSSQVFSMMVVMALVTTAMTGPLINFYKKREPALFKPII
jgi:Kef-type K+ transport system membrane component KefB